MNNRYLNYFSFLSSIKSYYYLIPDQTNNGFLCQGSFIHEGQIEVIQDTASYFHLCSHVLPHVHASTETKLCSWSRV